MLLGWLIRLLGMITFILDIIPLCKANYRVKVCYRLELLLQIYHGNTNELNSCRAGYSILET